MSSETDLQAVVNRANKAKTLLENELLVEAFSALESSYIAAWRGTRAEDQIGREKLFIAINIVGKVRENLQSVVQNGKLAQAELTKLYADQERKKRFKII